MFIFLITLCCSKAYHRPDHLIRIVEYHRETFIAPKHNDFTETRTQGSFWASDLISYNLLAVKKNIFFLAPLFCHDYFPSHIKYIHRDLNTGQFFWVLAFGSVISSSEPICSWRHCSIVLIFRATGTAFAGTGTQNILFGYLIFPISLILVSRDKHATFHANSLNHFEL